MRASNRKRVLDNFYSAFEKEHRGPEFVIKNRLNFYRPLLTNILESEKSYKALDLGCGRGEWLEILQENGFDALGVDLNDNFIQKNKLKGFNVKKEDANEFLKKQSKSTFNIITAFHLVEHIPFENLFELVSEALRVLKPGGILIIETPNIENFGVMSGGFYNDPTHIRPVPCQTLIFLLKFLGFHRSVIVRLQEDPNIKKKGKINFFNAVLGSSPDIAVVAQKKTSQKILTKFNHFFNNNYGISTTQTIQKYSDYQEQRDQEIEKIMNSYKYELDKFYNSRGIVIFQFVWAIKKIAKKIVKKIVIKIVYLFLKYPLVKKITRIIPFRTFLNIKIKEIYYSKIYDEMNTKQKMIFDKIKNEINRQ